MVQRKDANGRSDPHSRCHGGDMRREAKSVVDDAVGGEVVLGQPYGIEAEVFREHDLPQLSRDRLSRGEDVGRFCEVKRTESHRRT